MLFSMFSRVLYVSPLLSLLLSLLRSLLLSLLFLRHLRRDIDGLQRTSVTSLLPASRQKRRSVVDSFHEPLAEMRTTRLEADITVYLRRVDQHMCGLSTRRPIDPLHALLEIVRISLEEPHDALCGSVLAFLLFDTAPTQLLLLSSTTVQCVSSVCSQQRHETTASKQVSEQCPN